MAAVLSQLSAAPSEPKERKMGQKMLPKSKKVDFTKKNFNKPVCDVCGAPHASRLIIHYNVFVQNSPQIPHPFLVRASTAHLGVIFCHEKGCLRASGKKKKDNHLLLQGWQETRQATTRKKKHETRPKDLVPAISAISTH